MTFAALQRSHRVAVANCQTHDTGFEFRFVGRFQKIFPKKRNVSSILFSYAVAFPHFYPQ
ncbi:MAG: hypothetical protein AB7T86_17095 [Xanthobacteraceae bacterium]|uniref:hypothetical protein n=1 Tax=Pseudolabrys sp. TaxID=1960880 RepID=UPI003D14C45C